MIWSLIRMYWRPLAIAGLLLAVAGGVGLYGHSEYQAGRADERAEIAAQTRALEIAAQEDRDRADANYRGRILATQMREKDMADRLAGADRMLHDLRRRLQDTGTCGRLDDASGDDWLGIVGQSWAEYSDLAREAARLSDQVIGLQDYIRAIRK